MYSKNEKKFKYSLVTQYINHIQMKIQNFQQLNDLHNINSQNR